MSTSEKTRADQELKPYYDDGRVTLYHGDARDVLPRLRMVNAIITDPVWPNAHQDLAGADDPVGLLAAALDLAPPADRLVVWLGCQSDPRFLAAVPAHWPFLRYCHLRHAVPAYRGRCLSGSDIAYVFGEWPKARPGRMVLPGEAAASRAPVKHDRAGHPCPRTIEHAEWLVGYYSDEGETVLDPFAGIGTTLMAAKNLGRKAIGIEIEERYCEAIVSNLRQEVLHLEVPHAS